MSNVNENEQRSVLKFVIDNYYEQIQLANKENKPSKISVDYTLLNEHFQKEFGKDFLQPNFEVILNYVENRINRDKDDKNHIFIKLVEVPPNVILHDLDASYNGNLISAKAMIKNITTIYPKLKTAAWECRGCMTLQRLNVENEKTPVEPSLCPECGGRSFRLLTDVSKYQNVRYAKLEEPLELRNGGDSREFKAYLQDYLASPQHKLKPGDVVDVLGKFNVEKITPNKNDFEFVIDLHNITPVDDAFEDYRITESDKKKIRALSQTKGIYQKLVNTLMPEIYGYDVVKEGLLLQLFEGNRPKDDNFNVANNDRWTIHVLLIGDPGIGKSQIISALKKRAPKIMSVAGTSTSQAGLTTSAVKDDLTGTWTLEAGAVVLADTGVLCLDEYDKLGKNAQKSLNEPMEQMSVSSAKAGLLQVMSARTSIIACANPKYSRFDEYKSFREQINIPESNLSRFDLVFALNDKIDEKKDYELATNLLHKEKFIDDVEVIDLELFKKYITYAKMECFPELDENACNYLVEFYVETRQEAQASNDGKPITTRDLMALERLTIARAKTELRDVATVEDAKDAIRIYSEALKTIGLSPQTAGERDGIPSRNEMGLRAEAESRINALLEMGDMTQEDIVVNVVRELKVINKDDKIDLENLVEEVFSEMASK